MAKSLHTPEYEHFRALLVASREHSGLTQAEVAAHLRRPQSFVAKYEGGERRLDVIEFLQICDALKTNPHEFISALQAKVAK